MLRRVAGCSHISVCMAGARTTGEVVASKVAVRASSLIPDASRPSSDAVAGANNTATAPRPSPGGGLPEAAVDKPVTGGPPGVAGRGRRPQESLRGVGDDATDIVPRFYEEPGQVCRLVGRDAASDAEDDVHSACSTTTLSSAISSRAMERGLRESEWT